MYENENNEINEVENEAETTEKRSGLSGFAKFLIGAGVAAVGYFTAKRIFKHCKAKKAAKLEDKSNDNDDIIDVEYEDKTETEEE